MNDEARLLAGEVDEDVGPTFVLAGRVVTMASPGEVLDGARLVVSQGRIVAVVPQGEELPAEHQDAPLLETGGTIYPGLIDLHNHFVYDVLPLWVVPKRYDNRSQWPRAQGYSSQVTLPVRALAETPSTAKAIVRFVEGKALVGGTTTGQGMRTRVQGGPSLFRGAMRNVEETDDPRLPEAGTLVPSLYVAPDRVASFKRGLTTRAAYFYHLAEGIDPAARRTFTDLRDNDLLAGSLVGIHCLGLGAEDLGQLAEAGAKGVWSPFSNLLLYGKTLDLAAVRDSGLLFSLGCDWTPTGSKNLLEELKVARWVVEAQSAELTSEDLVRAVTADAARVCEWGEAVGTLQSGALADLLVLGSDGGDAFDALIDATERDVALVVTHGVPRYGDPALMSQVHADAGSPLEDFAVGDAQKSFYLQAPDSDLNEISFTAARQTLLEAMADLPGFRARGADEAELMADGEPSFALELDNEYEPTPDELLSGEWAEADLMADWSVMAESVELDTPEVGGGDYWQRIDAQQNIADGLKRALKDAYGG
jgi:cytosine/adenosine deaminase-related metal-dependent hydrolase